MRWNQVVGFVAGTLFAVAGLGCSGDGGGGSTPKLVPKTVTLAGNAQSSIAGTLLPSPISVTVLDQNGDAMTGVAVTLAVATGNGTLGDSSLVTNVSGVASTTWTLGPTAGSQSVGVVVAGYTGTAPVFTASANAGAAAALALVSGDNQTAVVTALLPGALVVRVVDSHGNAVAGVPVTWAAATGGGSVTNTTVATTVAGLSSVARTLGPTFGAQSTTASVAGTVPATITFNATGISGYSVTVRYLSTVTPARQAVFDAAAARWAQVIIGDVPDLLINQPAGTICGATYPAINETIDDVLIFVTLDSIDGPGNILGAAGPCAYRVGTKFSLVGAMRFDTADVALMEANNIFNAVILHEMGHVLGIGTLWTVSPSLLVGSVASGGTDPYFSGANAITRFNSSGGAVYPGIPVPVENSGGAGTVDAHWRESVMGKELMTGYVSITSNPLSSITVGSLADMGYTVIYSYADPYTVNSANLGMAGGGADFHLIEAIPDWTVRAIDAQGRLSRMR